MLSRSCFVRSSKQRLPMENELIALFRALHYGHYSIEDETTYFHYQLGKADAATTTTTSTNDLSMTNRNRDPNVLRKKACEYS